MKLVRNILTATLLSVAMVTAGCGGGDTTVKANTQTKGQELLDLQKAKDAGLISQREYEEQKKKIMKRD